MATLEMVEKLVERANVTYDEAKAALEACGDDLLEAMIHLERMGKVAPPQNGGYYSTKMQPSAHAAGGGPHGAYSEPHGHEGFKQAMARLWGWICKVIDKGNSNNFEVWREEKRGLSVPVTVLVLLTVFCFWIVLPLLVIGLFFGCRYRFCGPELGDSQVNSVMDSVAKTADTIKTEIKTEVMQYNEQYKEHKENKEQQKQEEQQG